MISDLRPVTAVRGPVGPVLLLPCLAILVTNVGPGAVLPIPPLEQLRTAVRHGRCEDCAEVWPAIDDHVAQPVFKLDHLTGCAGVARLEEWLARSGIPGGFAGVRWEVERLEMRTEASATRRDE